MSCSCLNLRHFCCEFAHKVRHFLDQICLWGQISSCASLQAIISIMFVSKFLLYCILSQKNLAMSLRTTFCKIVSMWHLGGIRFSATMMFRMFGRPPPLGVGYLYKHHEHNNFHHHHCLDHNNGNYDHDDHSDFIKVIPCGRSVGVAMSLASWGLTIIYFIITL